MNLLKNLVKFILIISLVFIVITLQYSHIAFFQSSYAEYAKPHSALYLSDFTFAKQGSFVDSHGMLNVVGVVDNVGSLPAEVQVGLNVSEKSNSEHTIGSISHLTTTTTTTMIQPLYGKTIYPLGGSPFKFVINPNIYRVQSKAFLFSTVEKPTPKYNTLIRLNYSNLASRTNGLLAGTAKNIGPVDLHNVSVYASAHDINGIQIDSVKSHPISTIKPGQEIRFNAFPDPTIKSKIWYYSCAGINLNDPINTISIGDGKFVAYDLQSIAKVSDFRYDNSTDSIKFGIEHYNPNGGPLTLKLAQLSHDHKVFVTMDGKPYPLVYNSKTTVNRDGKTIRLDLFIPKGEHQFVISGVSDRRTL